MGFGRITQCLPSPTTESREDRNTLIGPSRTRLQQMQQLFWKISHELSTMKLHRNMKNSTSTIASSDKDTIKPFLFIEESLADPRKGLFGAAFWARRGPSTNGRSDPSTARSAQSVFEFSGKRNITMQATRALLLAPLVLAITVTTASNVNAGRQS